MKCKEINGKEIVSELNKKYFLDFSEGEQGKNNKKDKSKKSIKNEGEKEKIKNEKKEMSENDIYKREKDEQSKDSFINNIFKKQKLIGNKYIKLQKTNEKKFAQSPIE